MNLCLPKSNKGKISSQTSLPISQLMINDIVNPPVAINWQEIMVLAKMSMMNRMIEVE